MTEKCNCHAEGLATFVLGALMGAALGVLFAPAKGETTRRKIKRFALDAYEEGKEELAERVHDVKECAHRHEEELREKAARVKESLSERAGEMKERLGEKAEEFKHRAMDKTENLREKAADELEKAAKKIR